MVSTNVFVIIKFQQLETFVHVNDYKKKKKKKKKIHSQQIHANVHKNKAF